MWPWGVGWGQRARDVAMTVWVTCPEETCEYLGLFLQVHVPPPPPSASPRRSGRSCGRLASVVVLFRPLAQPARLPSPSRQPHRSTKSAARRAHARTHAHKHARAPSHAQELGNEAAAVCAEKRPRRIKPGTAEWARAQLVQRNTSGIA